MTKLQATLAACATALALTAAPSVVAGENRGFGVDRHDDDRDRDRDDRDRDDRGRGRKHKPPRSVPEFDPAMAGAIAAALAGGGVLIARRRRNR